MPQMCKEDWRSIVRRLTLKVLTVVSLRLETYLAVLADATPAVLSGNMPNFDAEGKQSSDLRSSSPLGLQM